MCLVIKKAVVEGKRLSRGKKKPLITLGEKKKKKRCLQVGFQSVTTSFVVVIYCISGTPYHKCSGCNYF